MERTTDVFEPGEHFAFGPGAIIASRRPSSVKALWLLEMMIARFAARIYPVDPSDEVIRAQLHRDWPEKGPQAIGIWTSYWRTFLNSMQKGDIVVFAPKAPWVAIGEVNGPYEYARDESEGRLRHRRPVRWLNPDVTRSAVDADLLGVINAPGTICEIGRPDAADRLVEIAGR